MKKPPSVSVVVLNYNSNKYIYNCLKSVLESDFDNFELIIVDNCSTDNSLEIIEKEFKDNRIIVIRNDRNVGFAKGNNIGAHLASGKYLVLLNVDTVVDNKWLTELVDVMETDNTIGIAQPKLLSLSNKSIYDSAGDYLDYYGNNFRRGGEWEERDIGQYDTVHEIFSARGAAFITRKDIVDNIGLFDDEFFMTIEDIDFCWRTRLFGKRIVLVPMSIVYHKGRGITIDASISRHIEMHSFKNIKSTMFKNYSRFNMIRHVIFPLILDIVTGFFLIEPFLVDCKSRSCRIISKLEAYYWVLANLRTLNVKRRHVQKNIRRVSDHEVMRFMLKYSPVDYLRWLINVKKFGHSKARMIHFNKGLTS